MKNLLLLILMLPVSFVNGHEGHDKTPGVLSAPHGGMIKGTDELYLEVVTSKKEIQLYPLDHDMKALPLSDVKIEAKMSLPRKKISESLKLESANDHLKAKVDAKGAHRYELEVHITHAQKTEKLKFNIEPH